MAFLDFDNSELESEFAAHFGYRYVYGFARSRTTLLNQPWLSAASANTVPVPTQSAFNPT